MNSPALPHCLSISLNLEITTAIQGDEGLANNIPSAITQGLASFHILGLASSSDKGVPKNEVHEAALEAGLIENMKSQEITRLQDLLTRLHREAEHHQNISDFYRVEGQHAMETLAFVKRKLAWVTRLIRFRE
ncbi:hypothetical protein AMTR_s00089p00089430 [Amborella trichopoda]|uniref:Uncharacterized protein n=1 Tax=Amborella trichopoda TaxID=13333 RepID=W1P1Q6_AMBTC|nr:hypothetical protein AMTR_s00089p00089430 [Amborella trichopoda]